MRSNMKVSATLLARSSAFAIIALMTFMTTPASAAVVNLSGGWQVSWDDSFNGLVDIQQLSFDDDVLTIRKTATFTQPPVNGIFPPIPITFRQTSQTAANHIVIDYEVIQNSTGLDWTDFHIDLLGSGAVFNPDSTSKSGGPAPIGWDIAPFTQAVFTATLKRLDIWGGVVAAEQPWKPGIGPSGGLLWLDVFPGQDFFTSFTLKESPTPEPATLGLLALGGVALLSRRGRRVAA